MKSDEQLKRLPKGVDWLELFRSMGLFFGISRFLACVAVMVVSWTNKQILTLLYAADDKGLEDISAPIKLFKCFTLIGLIHHAIVTLCGIWGFSRLNRHMLAFYVFAMIVASFGMLFFRFVVGWSNTELNEKLQRFNNYKTKLESYNTVEAIQRAESCCGTPNYKFEDLLDLPPSCCPYDPNATDISCSRKKAFQQPCSVNKTTLYSALQEQDAVIYVTYIVGCSVVTNLIEVVIAYKMIILINKFNARGSSSHEFFTY